MMSRFRVMEAESDIHVNAFLASYKKVSCYVLAYAIVGEPGEEPDLVTENCVAKREINVRQAWEIGRNDLDVMGVAEDDQPIIPADKLDAPVLGLLQWQRSLKRLTK